MKEKLEKQLLQTITIHEREVQWANDEKEIWVNGHLFDIKTTSFRDHHFTFTGLFDEQETILVKNIQQEQQKEKSDGAPGLVKLFKLMVVIPGNDDINSITSCIKNWNDSYSLPYLYPVYAGVITPPPQIS
jgi:hypothetical protein